jgi:cytochrome c oxidase subunit 2
MVPDSRDGDAGRQWLIRGGIILPLIVLSIVFGYTVYTLATVENGQDRAALRVNVTARRWWWEVEYPSQDVTTANEIHIPAGVPVQFQLRSEDVIHSFWIPQLHGKMDVIPPHITYLTLQADQPGIYRGECAEYCGLQHALMGLLVVAQSPSDFEQWLAAQKQPALAPGDATAQQGQQVFISSGCVYCHAVRGLDQKNLVASTPDLGPDLTHLNSRLTIVGASLTNNPGNLAGWVMDAQHIKPGSDMSEFSLNSRDLQSLLAYLQSLR